MAIVADIGHRPRFHPEQSYQVRREYEEEDP